MKRGGAFWGHRVFLTKPMMLPSCLARFFFERLKGTCICLVESPFLGVLPARCGQAAARGAEFGSAFRLALLGMYVRDPKNS